MQLEQTMCRVGTMMSWLVSLEQAAQVNDNYIAKMVLFNEESMRGSLPYEFHVRKRAA